MLYTNPKMLYYGEPIICQVKLKKQVLEFNAHIEDMNPQNGIFIQDPKIENNRLEIGQTLHVTYFRPRSAYQFDSRILARGRRKGEEMLLISFPGKIVKSQLRDRLRAEIPGVVHFQSANDRNTRYQGYIKDLSASGLAISTPKKGMFAASAVPIGESIYLDITLSKSQVIVGLIASIVRVTPDTSNSRNVVVQMYFTKITDHQRDKLEMIVRKGANG